MAGLVPQSTLEQIRASNDIVEVIGASLPLKRAGANFVALCPFHREKSPSFNVNPHRQIFHCFGCHKGGDVFTFIKEYENLTFMEAVRRLAERANIPLEMENNPGQQQARHLKETLLQIHEQITVRWQTALSSDPGAQLARDYLAKRGVTDEAVQLFRLGYAPELWDDTVNWARSKGHDLAMVEQAGLILRKEETGRHYDRFRGRLMFPICDEQGRVVGFSGRVLAGDEKTAKYVNSPETPIFTKGRIFYGLDKSKRAILEAGFAIICEGQLDLIACFMAGTRNIVAPQGTAFTPDHARILKRYVEEVVLCFDSDNAGQNAAVRVFDSLLASGLAVRVACVPPGQDPDSFIREQGGAAFQQLIAKAEGFFDFYLNRLSATNDPTTDRGRMAVVKAMAEAVLKTGSAVLADTYAQKTAQRLAVSAEAVRSEFRRATRAKTFPASDPEPPPEDDERAEEAEPMARPSEREFWLLRFLLSSDEHIEWTAQHLDVNWIEHPVVRRIVAARLAAHQSQSWHGIPGLIDDTDDDAVRALITEAIAGDHPKEELDKNTTGVALQLRNGFIDRQLAALRIRLSQINLEQAEAEEIIREQAEWRRRKQAPLGGPGGTNLQ